MKKMFSLLILALPFVLGGCSFTQEVQDGVTFEGLKTFYVEPPEGGSRLLNTYGTAGAIDETLRTSIADFLKAEGYEEVDSRAAAQIIFRPLWSVSMKENPLNDYISDAKIRVDSGEYYATLEIQAILPNSDYIWAWRGFSPIEMTAKNTTDSVIREQVRWCLEKFPPEKNPSRMQQMKAEKQEQQNAEDQANPYQEVLIKERANQEAAALQE